MPSFDDIVSFVKEWVGDRIPVTESTSVQVDMGLHGDDVDAFLIKYSKRFGVDFTGYLWYFHKVEEGINFGGFLFDPPNRRVRPILITVGMLYDFAQKGRWSVAYPEHELPGRRLDILINQVLALGFVCFVFVFAVIYFMGL